MFFIQIKKFRNIKHCVRTLKTIHYKKMTAQDYMPVLKYWFNVNDLAEIKAEKYPRNNLVTYFNKYF